MAGTIIVIIKVYSTAWQGGSMGVFSCISLIKKWNFLLKISSVNVAKSADWKKFIEEILNGKLDFLCIVCFVKMLFQGKWSISNLWSTLCKILKKTELYRIEKKSFFLINLHNRIFLDGIFKKFKRRFHNRYIRTQTSVMLNPWALQRHTYNTVKYLQLSIFARIVNDLNYKSC